MAKVIECDQDGNPRIYYVVGSDPNDPQKVIPVVHEVRPGGMVVIKEVPTRPTTVAPDPVAPPTVEQVERERMERAALHVEKEREAIRDEREARGQAEPEGGEDTGPTNAVEADEEEAAEAAARDAAARKAQTSARRRTPAKSR